MAYNRQLEDRTRLTVNGKQIRVGNPNHPYNEMYRRHGLQAVIMAMDLSELKPTEPEEEEQFPWISVVFGIALISLIIGLSVGSQ